MKIFVAGGRKGAQKGAAEGLVTVVVDALRASATLAPAELLRLSA